MEYFSYKSLVPPLLMLLSAFFAFKASKVSLYKSSLLVTSIGFMVMFFYFFIPIVFRILLLTVFFDSELVDVQEYTELLITASYFILVIGCILLAYSMYAFSKDHKNV